MDCSGVVTRPCCTRILRGSSLRFRRHESPEDRAGRSKQQARCDGMDKSLRRTSNIRFHTSYHHPHTQRRTASSLTEALDPDPSVIMSESLFFTDPPARPYPSSCACGLWQRIVNLHSLSDRHINEAVQPSLMPVTPDLQQPPSANSLRVTDSFKVTTEIQPLRSIARTSPDLIPESRLSRSHHTTAVSAFEVWSGC